MQVARRDLARIAGVLYVVAVFQFFVFELVAETLYPGYSVSSNYISDLGATCPAPPSTVGCIVHQPSATIFDSSLISLGLLLLVATLLVYRGNRKVPYLIVSALTAVAIGLNGVFPENTGWVHAIVSEVAFWGGGISLILACRVVDRGPIRYLLAGFGSLTLLLTLTSYPPQIGVGGEERLLVLCLLFGLATLGGYLLAGASSASGP
jgi:hypothetical membrane protein